MNPQPHAVLLPWITQLSPAMGDTDWSLLADLALVPRGTIPDFLCPPPSTPMPTLCDELETLRRAPEQVIRSEVSVAYGNSVPSSLQRAMDQPSVFVSQLTDLIKEFWRKAVGPHWALLRARLEGEMLYRARALALGGVEELIRGLHKDVSLREGSLMVRAGNHWDGRQRERGLLLVPSIFSWPDVFLTVGPPWRTAIIYPSRGIAELWDAGARPTPLALQQLVGPSCAKVINGLRVPRTTLEMSAVLGLSPAATSEQITKLWNVGILERMRVGRRVFYSLNDRGSTLLTTFPA
jgi:DNA-binding transcriptional ArsR family regulator